MIIRRSAFLVATRENIAFVTLVLLLIAALLLGGSARDDVPGLIVLRPFAIICLGIGLALLPGREVMRAKSAFLVLAAILLLVLAHLMPLPPSVWTSLPGRELAAQVAGVAGIEQPWRPLTLVPWRGWNAFFSLLVPAAALVLALGCSREQQRWLPAVFVLLAIASALFGMLQAASGYSSSLYLYAITNMGSPTGFFANRNHGAALMACAIPLLAFSIGQARWNWRGPDLSVGAGLVILTLMMVIVLRSGSRAGLVLAALAFIFSLAIYDFKPRGGRKLNPGQLRLFRVAALAFGLGLTVLIALVYYRASSVTRLMATNDTEELRTQVWGPIMDMVVQFFPFGSGFGSFVEVFKVGEPTALLTSSYLNHAHNDWLEWALEGGLPAILLMLAAVGLWLKTVVRLLKARRTDPIEARLGLAGAFVILLLGLAGAVDYQMRVPSLACMAAVAGVLMTRAASRIGDDGAKSSPREAGAAMPGDYT